MSDKVRAEFEAFVSSQGLNTAIAGGLYRSQIVCRMWQAWLAAKEKYEPSIKASYYAVVAGRFIQQDTRSGQLEIYDTEEEAIAACPHSCEVIEIVASAVSAHSTQGEEK